MDGYLLFPTLPQQAVQSLVCFIRSEQKLAVPFLRIRRAQFAFDERNSFGASSSHASINIHYIVLDPIVFHSSVLEARITREKCLYETRATITTTLKEAQLVLNIYFKNLFFLSFSFVSLKIKIKITGVEVHALHVSCLYT